MPARTKDSGTRGTRLVTMRELNSRGRFGNQLLQRSFVKAYAQERQAAWGVTPWVGRHLFGLDDPGIAAILPKFAEMLQDGDSHRPVAPVGDELIGYDYAGWCQFPTAWWNTERRKVWQDYQPTAEWLDRLRPISEAFSRSGVTIGIQIRRGDYGLGSCYDAITPIEWYLHWLDGYAQYYSCPVRLFIATEDRELVEAFAKYNPSTVESLGVCLRADPYPHCYYLPEDIESGRAHLLDWFPEWYALTQCNVLLAANSTFSLTAAMASRKSPVFWRPAWEWESFVREDVWNCLPLRLDCPRKATP